MVSRSDAALARSDATIVELRKTNAPPILTPLAKVPHQCSAWLNEFRCTFTNRTEEIVATCASARLARKDNSSKPLDSGVLCSGPLRPQETTTVTVPWLGGNADDICFSKSPWGNVGLDWKICEFSYDGTREKAANSGSPAP